MRHTHTTNANKFALSIFDLHSRRSSFILTKVVLRIESSLRQRTVNKFTRSPRLRRSKAGIFMVKSKDHHRAVCSVTLNQESQQVSELPTSLEIIPPIQRR